MSYIMKVALIGYLTGLCGFLPGILFSKIIGKMGQRIKGGLMGFTGGLLIAFVCFEMLPKAFEISGLYFSVAGIFAGIFVCAYLEKRIPAFAEKINLKSSDKDVRMGILLALGFAMHNIPEGMAIGSLINISINSGMKMAVILSIHCFPEAVAVSMPFINSGLKFKKFVVLAMIFSVPICFGTIAGAVLAAVSPVFISMSLGVAGGVMIYITCGEIIPNSKDVWKGRLTPVLATIGFIAGVVLTAGI